MRQPSIMNHDFGSIPAPQIQRSAFNKNHAYKSTFDEGDLIPFFFDEVLPGDTKKVKATLFARLQTLDVPIMDNVFLDTQYFFVPNRLLWDNWQKFCGEQTKPGDSIDYEIPHVGPFDDETLTFDALTLGDFFGLPTDIPINEADYPSALLFRAYCIIWNEWYRDQNLQDPVNVSLGDGPDFIIGGTPGDPGVLPPNPLKRCKRADYFTKSLPWAQKGDDVFLPLGTTAPVIGDGTSINFLGNSDDEITLINRGTANAYQLGGLTAPDVRASPYGTPTTPTAFSASLSTLGLHTNPLYSGMIADLTGASSASINALRQAFALQKMLERDARGGTRYVEILKSQFGVTSPDFRLQRPEYLGGHSQRVGVREVPQTSQSGTTPQGNLAAYGNVTNQSGFNKSFVEHGVVIGLASVRADISYQNGMDRMWSRKTRYDFYWPPFAHLGEQEVLRKELVYIPSIDPLLGPNSVWGYQERWGEYRCKNSKVTGAFRSNYTGSLDVWHLAIDFSNNIPELSDVFIQDNPPLERVINVEDEPHILMDGYIEYHDVKPMPTYSVPGLADRF